MTKLEQAIADGVAFLDALQVERDERARTMATTTSPIERAFCEARLQTLATLVADAKRDLARARRLQFTPAFSGFKRRQLKAPLWRPREERKRA